MTLSENCSYLTAPEGQTVTTPRMGTFIALFLLFAAGVSEHQPARRRGADDRGRPQRDLARLLAEHPRGRREGGEGAGRHDRLARTAARGRARVADLGSRAVRDERCVGDRAGAARRGRARATGGRRETQRHSRRRHRLGPEGERLRQLRGDRQPPRGSPRRRSSRDPAPGQGKDRAAALRRRLGEHDPARGRISRVRSCASRHADRQRESVRRRRRRGRVQEERGAAERAQAIRRQPRRRRHLHTQRVDDARDDARARRQRVGAARCVSSGSMRPTRC